MYGESYICFSFRITSTAKLKLFSYIDKVFSVSEGEQLSWKDVHSVTCAMGNSVDNLCTLSALSCWHTFLSKWTGSVLVFTRSARNIPRLNRPPMECFSFVLYFQKEPVNRNLTCASSLTVQAASETTTHLMVPMTTGNCSWSFCPILFQHLPLVLMQYKLELFYSQVELRWFSLWANLIIWLT